MQMAAEVGDLSSQTGITNDHGVKTPSDCEPRAKVAWPEDISLGSSDDRDQGSDAGSSDDEVTYYDRAAVRAMDRERVVELCLSLQSRHRVMRRRTADLMSRTDQVSAAGDTAQLEVTEVTARLQASETELTLAREALAALKVDRKRLKEEKFDLLNQMKQLYQTLEDKENELRDFIRNYEQRLSEGAEALRLLSAERDLLEREWLTVLRRDREEADRCQTLTQQLSDRDGQLQRATRRLRQLRGELWQSEFCSDQETPAGTGQPPADTPSGAGLAPTASGRGSSADSGVRVGSDRESVAAGTSGNLSDSNSSGEGVKGPGGSPAASPAPEPSVRSHTVLSRSADQLDALERLEHRLPPRLGKQGAWSSISRVFSRQKQRKHLPMAAMHSEVEWSPPLLTGDSHMETPRLLGEAQQLPMERWRASMVPAWLQVTLDMPQYGPACAENARSGKVMLELTDADLERSPGIQRPLHRKRLRMTIEELRQPHLCKCPYISQLNHGWVTAEWLPNIGLAQYADIFSAHLIDGRMLAQLTKMDLENT